MSVTGTRVFGHPQVVEYQAYVTRESSHFLRHAPSAFGFEHADGETTKPSEIFRTVVIIVPIDHVVATLDGPVAAVDPQNALRSGLFRRAAGEAVTDFERTLTALFVRAVHGKTPRAPLWCKLISPGSGVPWFHSSLCCLAYL